MGGSSGTAAAPFSLSPSWSWEGDDGSWSTFSMSVGTPPQSFHVLPSTAGAEVWVPIPEGCAGILAGISDCGKLRGVQNFNGVPSRGFQTNSSSSWDLMGIYKLATDQNLWGKQDRQSLYGQDTVTLENYASGAANPKLKSQTVAGVSTANIWLGSLGLNPSTGNFSVENNDIPSLMQTLKNQSIIPSLSFGYTAGASYSSPQTPGSLVLGGYDQARFKLSSLSFPLTGTDKQSLTLNVKSIVAENVFGGTQALSRQSITTVVDSTVAQMWLPKDVCDLFASAFGLKYDTPTGLYIVNNTIHNQLKRMNPSVTFTVGGSDDSSDGSTTNIIFPYAAFDLQANIPLFNFSTNYFPLRVAASSDQQVLGRAFLQEAYIFVDWERRNFTLGQAIHQNSTSKLVAVQPPTYGSPSSSSLSTGAIVGIAVGACALIAIIIGTAIYFIIRSRRKSRKGSRTGDDPLIELSEEDAAKPHEMMSHQVYELSEGEGSKHEIYSKQVSELQGESPMRELDGEETEVVGKGVPVYAKRTNEVYEMP